MTIMTEPSNNVENIDQNDNKSKASAEKSSAEEKSEEEDEDEDDMDDYLKKLEEAA
jgi:hypothetical protein